MDINKITQNNYLSGIREFNAAFNCGENELAEQAGVNVNILTNEAFETFKSVLKVWELVRPADEIHPDEPYEILINDPI